MKALASVLYSTLNFGDNVRIKEYLFRAMGSIQMCSFALFLYLPETMNARNTKIAAIAQA